MKWLIWTPGIVIVVSAFVVPGGLVFVQVGELYLHGGASRDRQIVPRDYVAEATAAQVSGGLPEGLGYGFLWWVDEDAAPRRYLAAGYAGQFVLVVPADDLVIAGTGEASRLPPSWTSARHVAATVASTQDEQ